ncbi:MAG: prolipoprotein diacylglyceryl transferase [Cyanobacteria bacterium]|nr:prolipoprotein diacylglyceryl transferase [Cyanobacteriota bacterium]
MIFASPGATLIEWGPVAIRWYGLLYAVGFLVALEVAAKYVCPPNITKDQLSNFFIGILLWGLVGARLWYVILNTDYYWMNPIEIPQIWLGGQSIQGGIIGGALGTWIFDRNNYLTKLAIAATVVPLAQAIARWGNFFNEEAYGSMTNVPWGLYISHTEQFHHPCFLYESIWNLISFTILMVSFKSSRPLRQIAKYLLLYSIGRLLIEQLRLDQILVMDGMMSAGTLMAIVGIVVGLGMIITSQSASKHS